jgi:hypothetical protein
MDDTLEYTGEDIAARMHCITQALRDLMMALGRADMKVDRSTLSPRSIAMMAAFARATTWMRVLAKLPEASDGQAIHAASRALLEIAVDLALLHMPDGDSHVEHLRVWEQCQLLKAAHKHQDFLDRMRKREDFAQRFGTSERTSATFRATMTSQAEEIERQRVSAFPGRPRAPDRWTNRSLLDDCRFVDEHACKCCQQRDMTFEQVYSEYNSFDNWGTHGSGTLFVQGLDEDMIYGSNAISLRNCIWSAHVAIAVMRHENVGLIRDPEVRELIRLVTKYSREAMNLPPIVPSITQDT